MGIIKGSRDWGPSPGLLRMPANEHMRILVVSQEDAGDGDETHLAGPKQARD